MMNKVQFLLASKPCEPLKSRSLYVVLLVKVNVSIERCRTRYYLNYEQTNRQHQVCAGSDQKHGNEKEGRVIAFVTKVFPRDQMVLGIVSVVEVDVVAIKITSRRVVA